ncbi:ATP-binding cassette domain-containing protein [Boudabousia tangfeifanii]|nr:ABC transporter ATP-binding protein [Boudabousia tangfeifanii]
MSSVTKDMLSRSFIWSALSSSWYAIKDALKFSFPVTIALCVARLVEAALPALQVFIVGYLIAGRPSGNMSIWEVLLLVVVTGGIMPLSAMVDALNLRLQFMLRYAYTYEVIDIYASLTPAQRRDSVTIDEVQAAHDSIPFNLSWQASSALNIIGAFTTAVLLFSSLANFDLLAASLVTVSLLPQLFGYSLVAKAENFYWPKQAATSRRAEYLENQLRYARSGTELSVLNGAEQFAHWAKVKHGIVRGYWMKIMSIRFTSAFVSGFIALLLIAGALSSLIWRSQVPTSLLAAAILGVVSAMLATKSAGSAYGELMASAPIVMRYLKLRAKLDSTDNEDEAARLQLLAPRTSNILMECEDVDFAYSQTDENVLNNLCLEVEQGKIVALVGANGAGKSTAIKVLTGQLKPQTGQIYSRLGKHEVAIMPQDIEKFELTVREFLTLPYYTTRVPSDQELWQALEKVDLASHVKALSDGLDAQLGEQWDGTDLSGGQWQRLALARTLLSDAKLLVLDEPTSSVDAESESKLFKMLKAETPERAVLLVSHRAWTLQYADHIYLLENGTLAQSGTFKDLKNQDGRFRKLFESQDWNQDERR